MIQIIEFDWWKFIDHYVLPSFHRKKKKDKLMKEGIFLL